jgi:hypothetical protein
MIKASVIFTETLKAPERTVVNQGGTSSGKTWSVLLVLFCLAVQEEGCVITVTSESVPHLKKGAYRDAKTIYNRSPEIRAAFESINETDRTFRCRNRSVIEFTSFQDEESARGSKRDYLFVNEANTVAYEIYRQLELRTRKKVFIDYNPSARFWVHEELAGKPGVKLILSDHRHNPFLTKDEHERIEGITDPEFFKVYARGKTGRIEGLLFPESGLRFADLSTLDYSLASFSFSVGDPADRGGDFYAMPFCYVFFDGRTPSVVVHDVLFNRDGIEANTEVIRDRAALYGMEKVFIESNGGWVASAIMLRKALSTLASVGAYTETVSKQVRILSSYEFINRHFVFDSNYRAYPEYKAFIYNLTTYLREGKNKNDDAPDVLAAAANIVKIKYHSVLYGKG